MMDTARPPQRNKTDSRNKQASSTQKGMQRKDESNQG